MERIHKDRMEGRKMTEVDALGAWKPEEKEGVKDDEVWSVDMTFTDFILPRIQAFRKMKRHGYPVFEPLGTEDKSSEEEWKAIEERSIAEWENILFDIETAFKTLKDTMHYDRTAKQNEAIKHGLALFAKHYEHLWD